MQMKTSTKIIISILVLLGLSLKIPHVAFLSDLWYRVLRWLLALGLAIAAWKVVPWEEFREIANREHISIHCLRNTLFFIFWISAQFMMIGVFIEVSRVYGFRIGVAWLLGSFFISYMILQVYRRKSGTGKNGKLPLKTE